MKRPLPIWVAAAVPAALTGHGIAYAIGGLPLGARHAYVAPLFEYSLALIAAIAGILAGGALLRRHLAAYTAVERSIRALWPRLALLQIAIFVAMERAEGAHVTALGVLVQIGVAFLAAHLLSAFSRALERCARQSERALRYVARLFAAPCVFRELRIPPRAFALAVYASSARFSRPPPFV